MRAFGYVGLLVFATASSADTPGLVHPEPAAACEGFKPHQLCFELPKDGVARSEASSASFYAIVLKSAERCGIQEEERAQAQALFPRGKVFSVRFECDDDEDLIRYTNVNEKFAFLAVYAGATIKDAKKVLAEVRATGKFTGANIRKMQAVLVFP